jgi:outer membrane protein OmpA-like peptidoglycan-associated protein/WD40 repeat protein
MGSAKKSLCQFATIRICVFFVLMGVAHDNMFSQEIKFGRINFANYPIIECPFIYTGLNGEKDFTLQVKDFKIQENTQDAEVVEVINPKTEVKPVSVVLMFDISSSMKGERLALAKEAALGFLEEFPLETSEVAVASFSDQVYLNCDFTQNFDRLKESINKLEFLSGTNYSRAFLANETGAIDIVRQGQYKKAIVFLTDGLSSANSAEIIRKAAADNVSVYCISIALKMPEILKEISTQTGGHYFEALNNIYQLHSFYAAIGQLLQTSGFSLLRWKALNNCERKRSVKLDCRKLVYEFPYEVPDYLVGRLQADPNILYFGETSEKGKANASVTLTAVNQSFTINSLSVRRKNYFNIADSLKLPFELSNNKSFVVNLIYKNPEPGLITDALTIESKGCPSVQVLLNGGIEEQLKLISPAGGEVFTVGMDTAIIWEGVKQSRQVAMWYRTADSRPWKSIRTAAGLYSKWGIPNDTGVNVKVKLEPAFLYDRDFNIANRLVFKDPILFFASNNDGSLVLTIDYLKTLQLWNASNGQLLLTFAGYGIQEAMLSNDSKRIIASNGFETYVWEIASLKLMARYTNKQRLFLSHINQDGSENLLTTRLYKDIATSSFKAWLPFSNDIVTVPGQKEVTSMAISPGGLVALTFNNEKQLKVWDLSTNENTGSIKLYDDAQPVAISPSGESFAINSATGVKLYNSKGEALFHVSEAAYHMFSPDGKVLATSSRGMFYRFWDVSDGKLLFSVRGSFKMGTHTSKILYCTNDTLVIKDLLLNGKDTRIAYQGLKDAILSPNGTIVVIKNRGNVLEFYDIAENKFYNLISEFNGPIVQMKFSPDSKTLFTVMGNNQMQILRSVTNKKLTGTESGYFSIIKPYLKVKDTLLFTSRETNSACERMVPGFITNNTKYAVAVKGMEIKGGDSNEFFLVSNYFPCIIPGKSSKEIELRFAPTTIGSKNAVLYTYTATDTLQTLIYGNATAKTTELLASWVDFGKVKVNSTMDSIVSVLKNTGTAPIIINGLTSTGPNQEQFQFSRAIRNTVIAADSILKVAIMFKPKFRGRISGSLGITIKGIDEVQNIMLFGEGIASRETVITGRTVNSADSLPIEAEVVLTDLLSHRIVAKMNTISNGKFVLPISCDRNYSLTANKQNYISGSENLDLTGVIYSDTIKQDIYLTEIKSGALIRLNCVFFDFAKWELLSVSKTELNRLVDILNKYPAIRIEIHGHTDSIGSEQANLLLSQNRVNAVRNYLIKSGILPARLMVKYFGESVPIAPNATEQGRARNRRVEVKVE